MIRNLPPAKEMIHVEAGMAGFWMPHAPWPPIDLVQSSSLGW